MRVSVCASVGKCASVGERERERESEQICLFAALLDLVFKLSHHDVLKLERQFLKLFRRRDL